MRSLSRELILPALRLQVPDRPSTEHLVALADLSADEWTTRPAEWLTGQVVRLAVAEVLAARFAQAGVERGLPADAAEVTVAQVAGLFRPHVDLAAQSFRVAVVEAVNAGVPAVIDPLRDGLRQLGVTGRDPLWMVALGLDKVPARARTSFWGSVKGSVGLTAVVDALSSGGRAGTAPVDVSGLDPSDLARADALLQAGGRTLGVAFDRPAQRQGSSWLQVPLTLTRPLPWRGAEPAPTPGGVTVALRGAGWVEVHDTALAAVSAGTAAIDLGGAPRGRATGAALVLADRLAAARDRSLADVLASLRDIHPRVAEAYAEQVRIESVRVAIAAVDEDHLVQLWLPTSALAGPLLTGAADLVLGGAAVIRGDRPERGRADAKAGARGRNDRGRPGGGRSDQGRPDQGRLEQGRQEQGRPERGRPGPGRPEGGEPGSKGGRRSQSRRRGPRPDPSQLAEVATADESATASAPATGSASAPEVVSTPAPTTPPAPEAAPPAPPASAGPPAPAPPAPPAPAAPPAAPDTTPAPAPSPAQEPPA